MNVQSPTPQSSDLVVVSTLVPADVFGPGGVDAIIKKLTDTVRAVPTDISTATGRKAVASLAYKVARSKTALDEMGKTLAADWKAKANAIDAERRTIRDRLDALGDEVRKPLTDWENAEKDRVEAHEAALLAIPENSLYGARETGAEVRARLEYLTNYPTRDWQEFAERAKATLATEIARTRDILATVEKREAEAAELERLRAEQIAREQAERDARIAAEAAEKARLEAEAKARVEAESAERAAREEQARVEREREKAERAACEAEERARRAETEAAEAARRAEAARIAAAEKAERDRAAAIEAERQRVAREQEAASAATARREADKKHRAAINNTARDALVAAGLTAEQATLAVTAIAKGSVPNIKISY